MKSRFSVVDGLVLLIVCGLLSSLLLMRVARERAVARNESCSLNLKQIGLAFHNYHAAFKQLPVGAGGTDSGGPKNPLAGNGSRLSAFVGITPFMEQQALWEQIANPMRQGRTLFPPMGPSPTLKGYRPWQTRPLSYICPEDSAAQRFPAAISYVLNYGDGVLRVGAGKADRDNPNDLQLDQLERATQRGVFARQKTMKFRDILDGLSNTLMVSEAQIDGLRVARNVSGLAFDPSKAIAAQQGDEFWPAGRESIWADGLLRSCGFQTILPPGSPSATSDIGQHTAVMSASGHHGPGAHVLLCDGAVKFVTAEIDAGDASVPSVAIAIPPDMNRYARPGATSPYGIWGALGTRANREVLSLESRIEGKSVFTEPREGLKQDALERLRRQPTRTFTAANGRSKLEGWLASCTPEGQVILVRKNGDKSYLSLPSLSSEDAYFVVESVIQNKVEAYKVLLPQLEEAVGLLERKEFAAFIDRFVSKSDLDVESIPEVSAFVYLKRGTLIQILDETILVLKQSRVGWNDFPEDMVLELSSESVEPRLRMRFDKGRWTILSGQGNLRGRMRGNPRGNRYGNQGGAGIIADEIGMYEVMMESEK